MIIRLATFSIILFSTLLSYSQSSWVQDRIPAKNLQLDPSFAMHYLYRSVNYDYMYDEDNNFICDISRHDIVRVLNNEGLESVNKIYISTDANTEILEIRARAFTRDGNQVNLNQNNIQEIKDENTESGYRIFAIEGAEVGGEIEYYYKKRVSGSTFISELVQVGSPIVIYDFSVKSVENLEFDFLTVNNSDKVVKIDTTDSYNLYYLQMQNIPAFKSQAFSGQDANKIRIDFKLAYNTTSSSRRLNTWSDAGKTLYNNTHNLSREEQKVLEQFMKENTLKKGDVIAKFRNYEHEIKKRFYSEDNVSDDLQFLFTNGFGHKRAFVKLYAGIAKALGLSYELVVTSNRFDNKFENLDTWNYLDDFLMYLPDQKVFIAIHHENYRYGAVPDYNTATNGLYVSLKEIRNFSYPVSRIDYIPERSYEANLNNLEMKVSMIESNSKTIVDMKRIYIGREAYYYKALTYWADEKKMDEMLDDQLKYICTNPQIEELKVDEANDDWWSWEKPFVMSARYTTDTYLEQAGSTILFKVGDLIGMQSELYQQEDRIYDVENSNNRGYYRTIEFKIPSGYEIQNPEDIIIDKKVYEGDKPVFVFESSYEIKSGVLNISIEEFYDSIFFPKERFEEFRAVINAAADWNKVTLLLKPI